MSFFVDKGEKMDKKRKYANFLVAGCLRLKKGDKLFIVADDNILDFVEIVKEEASNLGILEIETLISYPEKEKELYLSKSYEEIIKSPLVDKSKYNEMAREGYAFLMLKSPIPNYFLEVKEDILARVSKYQMEAIEEYKSYQLKNKIKWNISAVPNEAWAREIDGVNSLDELWDLVWDICLINEENPVKAWDEKMTKLKNRANYLNNLKIDKLIYKNSLGTNLEIGLPKDYIFASADGNNIVNMPTEEVFTSPDRLRVRGMVYSSKVLIYNNRVIEDFWLEFKEGKIVDYNAKVGKEILKEIIETDEGSHYLGEVALVDYNSPISLTNIIFKNTLYDENASCHLAIGAGFMECIKDGYSLTTEELMDKGINYSHEHVDFFIGTKDLEVKALLQNGQEVVIMENGNFKEA